MDSHGSAARGGLFLICIENEGLFCKEGSIRVNKVWIKIAVAVFFAIILMGCNPVEFNQTTDKSELLTEKYSIIQIEALKNAAETGPMTFSIFKRDFEAQCVRKTYQGYYVVLLLEDDSNAFVFFDSKDILTRVMVSNGFQSKLEFQNLVTEQMSKSEVLSVDTNTIVSPVSAVEMTVHIVQEGVCIVKYLRFTDGEILENPTVASIEFVENESVAACEDPFIRKEIPFILAIDKVGK